MQNVITTAYTLFTNDRCIRISRNNVRVGEIPHKRRTDSLQRYFDLVAVSFPQLVMHSATITRVQIQFFNLYIRQCHTPSVWKNLFSLYDFFTEKGHLFKRLS